MKGTLSDGVLPGLLRELYVGRKTGLLRFSRGDLVRSVLFRKGHIVRAESTARDEHLGETLVRQGLLTLAALDGATEVLVRERKRLGIVLQEQGILDKDRLEDAMALHVRDVLFKIFAWSDASYVFEERDAEAPVDEDITLKVSTGEMILEAARRVQDPDVVRYALGDIDRILGLSTDPLLRFQKITLTPADGYVLSRVDGTLSAREVTQLIPMVPEETQRCLFGLLCTGVLEYLPLPPKATPRPEPARPRAAAPPAAPPSPAPQRPRSQPPPAAEATLPAPEPPRQAAAPKPVPPPPPNTAPAHPVAPTAAPPPPATAKKEAPSDDEARNAPEARRQEILDAFAGLKALNHFEVLGIPKASSEAQVKEAYFKLAKRFHPDAHHDTALADLHDKLEAVFIRLGEAYEVLRHTRSRSSYEADLAARTPRVVAQASVSSGPEAAAAATDPSVEAKLAEDAIRKAEKRVAEEKYWDAIQLLESAVPKAQGKWKQRGRVLLAKSYMKNPHWVKRGEEQLLTVVHEDPKNFEAYFVLGALYKAGGLKSRATTMFRKVLDIKPDHEEAIAELGALTPESPEPEEPAPGSGGLLKKLFGKN